MHASGSMQQADMTSDVCRIDIRKICIICIMLGTRIKQWRRRGTAIKRPSTAELSMRTAWDIVAEVIEQ